MGASVWMCFTPWTRDVEAALQRLRRETFLAGDYYRRNSGQGKQVTGLEPWRPAPWTPGEMWMEGDDDDGDFAGPPPASVDEAVEQAGEEGTHSILDIVRTAPFFEACAAAPLPESGLRRLLGTTQPSREQVEDRFEDVAEELDRWECVYLSVYRDGQPHELAFIGATGD